MTRRPIDARVSSGPGEDADDGEAVRDALRDAFARWPAGVAVVAAREDGRIYGMTVAALTPVSVEPPLLLVCIHNDAPLASVLLPDVACAVSILTDEQKRAANTFADRFTVPGGQLTDDALPVVPDAVATFTGVVQHVHDGGDHRIVVVRVDYAASSDARPSPLLYWQRQYRRLAPED